MDKKELLISTIQKTIFLVVAIAVSSIASSWLTLIITRLVPVVTYAISALIRFLVCTAITLIILYFATEKTAHQLGFTDKRVLIIACMITAVLHLILSLVLLFSPFWCGGVTHLSGFIIHGTEFDKIDTIEVGKMWIPFLIELFLECAYAGVVIWAEIRGANRRIQERVELTGSPYGVAEIIQDEDRQKETDESQSREENSPENNEK